MSSEQFGLLVIVLSLVQGVIALALKTYIEKSVAHEFDKRIEDYRTEIRQRERAAMIAELIAEWDSRPEDVKKLNQLVLEASLWLPEHEARELGRILTYNDQAKLPKELVIDIRRILQGKEDGLTAADLVHFKPTVRNPNPRLRGQ